MSDNGLAYVQLTCKDCLEEWSVTVSELSLELTILTHRALFHDTAPISYMVEPVTDEELG